MLLKKRPKTSASKHLSQRQLDVVARLGEIYLPGNENLPSFSTVHAEENLDRILNYMPDGDLKDLKTLLYFLSFFPDFLLSFFVTLIERSMFLPLSMGATVRLIRFGLRGLVFSLYYGDSHVHEKIGYSVHVYTDDQK